ncbi:MAG: ABC transporter ATP-binding protein, partial [Candidatus Atribacteria bacterium]|nr:ABC transporter ATP-binding protein [Candidatus Atribacteria bacterium]
MSNPVISVENLSKSYQLGSINTGTFYGDLKRWWARQRGKPDPYQKIGETDHGNRQGETLLALKDVSFTVEQGEALGIIGRNGAGKSTLLKILSRVTAPTSGEVKVKGRIASLLEVGTGFHPELTGRENIYLNGAIMGMSRAEVTRKFDEIMDFSGVEQFIDTPVKRYSSGMYVRLAFAVAAHLEPEILVVDEVLAVGDVEFQKKCLGKMSDVAHEGRTVLFVSHNMLAIKNLCNTGIYLEGGMINHHGDIDYVVQHYLQVSSSSSSYEQIWKDPSAAPGNEMVRLHHVSCLLYTF